MGPPMNIGARVIEPIVASTIGQSVIKRFLPVTVQLQVLMGIIVDGV
jgi:hypothetical protein